MLTEVCVCCSGDPLISDAMYDAPLYDSVIVEEGLLLFMRELSVFYDGLVCCGVNEVEQAGEETTKGGSKSVGIEVVIEIVLGAVV